MRRHLWILTVILVTTLAAATAALAQWSSDPAANLAVADREDAQAVDKIAGTSDGGAYVGWFDHASGNYDVYLQRLDALGFEQWPHNGILVSDHPQGSWIGEWHLIADSADHAVLAFADIRDEGNFSLNAYRVGPGGENAWGPDGIVLATAKDDKSLVGVRVAQASDGDFVFVWTEWTAVGGGKLLMQRVSPEGVVRFADGGTLVSAGKSGAPAYPDIAASNDGSVIVSWLTNNRWDTQRKYLVAQRIGADGSAVWSNPVSVFDECSLPGAYKPDILSDGEGGAFLFWHYTPGLVYNAAIQHLDADGREIFPHNGVTVAVNPDVYHFYPALSFDPLSGETYVFFREYDPAWGLYGLYGQRFSPQGERLWGDDGLPLVALSQDEVSYPLAMPSMGGSLVFWMDRASGSWDEVRVLGMRVESDGSIGWGGSPIFVSTFLSGKSELQAAGAPDGGAVLVWKDGRGGLFTEDVYGQNVNANGSLGN